MTPPLLEAAGLSRRYPVRSHPLGPVTGWIDAVREVDLALSAGETVGLVGESGCGKSTLARILAGLIPPSAGTVRFEGTALFQLDPAGRRRFRRTVQIIFQDPFTTLDPLMTIGQSVAEPLAIHRIGNRRERGERTRQLLGEVGLPPEWSGRFPDTLSGGQRQRVGIARALALNPRLLICDEAVSALDLSVQAQILALLNDLREKRGLALLFISHDLGVVGAIADRIGVMAEGRIVECQPNPALFEAPRHPAARRLVELALEGA